MIDRRSFLGAALGLLCSPLATLARAGGLESALASSPFVYVSPLRSDGNESRCHAEVWYGWIDGSVVLITGHDRWKARAVGRGLDRARIWVGDYGRWKRLVGHDESFRKGPSFVARAEVVRDAALLDTLLAIYDEKYPEEIGAWRDRMRKGYADGSRVLIRYRPDART